MNWVGGTRNRLKVKNERKKQMEFFEKQKYARRMKMYGKQGEHKIPSKPSLDLVSLQMATLTAKQFQSNDKSSKSNEQRNRVNMERRVYNNARLQRHKNVELPMSPNATPSILQLGDDIQSSTQEHQTSSSLHNFRRDVQVTMHHSQQYSQAGRPNPAPFRDPSVSRVKSTAREELTSVTQQLDHIRKNFSEDVFLHFPSSSKGSEWHDDHLPSHLSQTHGASSTEFSISSDTSEDSPVARQDLHVKQDSKEVTHVNSGQERKLAQPYSTTTNPATKFTTSCVPNLPIQSENSASSSLEYFRRHFRANNHKGGQSLTPSPIICLDTSTEDSPKRSSVGSIDLLCHESTNFTSPESICDQRPGEGGKCGNGQISGTGEVTTRKQVSENDLLSRWHDGEEVLICCTAATNQHPEIKTSLKWKSVCSGGVPQEPTDLCGDIPTLDREHKEGSLPVPSKSTDLPYGPGSSFTRAVLKEVLELDAELNGHLSPDDQCRPLKRRKIMPSDSLESFSLSKVPSTLDKSCHRQETAFCEETTPLISDRITPPVSPFTRNVRRRALESIALFTPDKLIAQRGNAEKLKDNKCVSEQSDSDISESLKTLSGQGGSAEPSNGHQYQSKASSVITSSLCSRDRGIQCQIASIPPTLKEQSTQCCSNVNKDAQIQTCRSLQCDAGTQWEEQEITEHENQPESGSVCDSLKSEEVLDDTGKTDSKGTGTSVVSIKTDEECQSEVKGRDCPPSAEVKLNFENREESIELLSQSTCSDSFDSCISV